MTGAIWKSAFVAAFFALHPLHVESVAWIAERKDVLSAFFWMLTLCLYIYYTEKPVIRRYLLVLFSFICSSDEQAHGCHFACRHDSSGLLAAGTFSATKIGSNRRDSYHKTMGKQLNNSIPTMTLPKRKKFLYSCCGKKYLSLFCPLFLLSFRFILRERTALKAFFWFPACQRACFLCDLSGENILASRHGCFLPFPGSNSTRAGSGSHAF